MVFQYSSLLVHSDGVDFIRAPEGRRMCQCLPFRSARQKSSSAVPAATEVSFCLSTGKEALVSNRGEPPPVRGTDLSPLSFHVSGSARANSDLSPLLQNTMLILILRIQLKKGGKKQKKYSNCRLTSCNLFFKKWTIFPFPSPCQINFFLSFWECLNKAGHSL